MPRSLLMAFLLILSVLTGGCAALLDALSGTGDNGGDLDSDGTVPVVMLSVSNPTPQVSEQVMLTCSTIYGDQAGVTFDFQPADGRLIVNRTAGTALLIVAEYDAGAAFAYTCTATNEYGTSRPSNEQVIVPTP